MRQAHEQRLFARGGGVLRRRWRRVAAGLGGLLVDRDGGLVDQLRGMPERAGLQVLDLGFDGLLVLRQLAGKVGELEPDDGADPEQDREREHHGHQDRRDAWYAQAAQQVHHRTEHEGKQHRQHQRDEHLPTEVERHDDDDGDRERRQARRAGRGGRPDLGRTKRSGREFSGHDNPLSLRWSKGKLPLDVRNP